MLSFDFVEQFFSSRSRSVCVAFRLHITMISMMITFTKVNLLQRYYIGGSINIRVINSKNSNN